MGNKSIENIEKVVFNSIYADKNSMSEKHQPIVPSMLQHMKVSLTPRLTRVPFRDVAILTAFFAHSCYSETLDPKWLLSLNSIS